eukprot:403365095
MTPQKQSQLKEAKVYQGKKYLQLPKIQMDIYEQSKKLNFEEPMDDNHSQNSTNTSFNTSFPQTPVISPNKLNLDSQTKDNIWPNIEIAEDTQKIIPNTTFVESWHYFEKIDINLMSLMTKQFSESITFLQEEINNKNLKQNNKLSNNNDQLDLEKYNESQAQQNNKLNVHQVDFDDIFFRNLEIQVQNLSKSEKYGQIDDGFLEKQNTASIIKKPSSTTLEYSWNDGIPILHEQQTQQQFDNKFELVHHEIPLKIRLNNILIGNGEEAEEQFRNQYLENIFQDMDNNLICFGDQIQYPCPASNREIENNNSDNSPSRFLTNCTNHQIQDAQLNSHNLNFSNKLHETLQL